MSIRVLLVFAICFNLFAAPLSDISRISRAPASANGVCARLIAELADNDLPLPQRSFPTKRIVNKLKNGQSLSRAEAQELISTLEGYADDIRNIKVKLQEIDDLIAEIGFKNLSGKVKKYYRANKKLVESVASIEDLERTIETFKRSGVQFSDETITEADLRFLLMANHKSILNQAGSFVKNNLFTFSPFIILPFSIMTGGAIDVAFYASLKLAAGIQGVDWGLERILQHAPKLVSKESMVLLTAATTNLPELGASQASALVSKDVIGDVGSTPLGSNWVNLSLLGVAFGSTLKTHAVDSGLIHPMQRMTMGTYWSSLRTFDYAAMRNSIRDGVGWMTSALIFQSTIRSFLRNGNPIPAAIWMMVNIPLLYRYFTRQARAQSREIVELIREIPAPNYVTARASLESNFDNEVHVLQNKIMGVMDEIESIRNANRSNTRLLKQKIRKLQKTIAEDPEYQNQLAQMIESMPKAELGDLLTALKLTPEDIRAYGEGKEGITQAIVWITAGASAIVLSSLLLDSGVSDLPEAIEGMEKSFAGFVLMAFFSSIGELLATKKLFLDGNPGGAAQNIADSNALNIMIAQMAMASSYFANGFDFKYTEGEEVEEEVKEEASVESN